MIRSGNLFQALNSNGKNLQVNTQIITLADNLSHPYFTTISLSKNNSHPIGVAVLEAPYTPYISNYWVKYKGVVIISFNMEQLKHTNTNTLEFLQSHNIKQYAKKQDKQNEDKTKPFEPKQRIENKQYNYSFIGKVGKFKEKGNKFIIYFQDIGWKFLQKVPKEFRETYIANQPLDKAFQAICEFLDVEFAYSIEDLSQYNFGADGYSVQKDGQTIEDVETILSEWATKTEENEQEENKDKEDELSDPKYENQSLIDLDKKNENNDEYVKKTNDDNKINEPQSNNQESIEKYQADFDQKILDLFIGNTYYESDIASNIMNYSKITIIPSSTSTSDNSTMTSSDINGDGKVDEKDGEEASKKILNKSKSGVALKGVTFKNGDHAMMTYDQVNALTPDQAYHESLRTDHYYHTTILRLRARAYLKHNIGPKTNYARFDH